MLDLDGDDIGEVASVTIPRAETLLSVNPCLGTLDRFIALSSKEYRMRAKGQSKSALELIQPNAARIDIGVQTHWVCVPVERTPENVRSFGCFTADLYALADWL